MANFKGPLATSVLNNLYSSSSAPSLPHVNIEDTKITSKSLIDIKLIKENKEEQKVPSFKKDRWSLVNKPSPYFMMNQLNAETATYKIRWYVLFLFSSYACLQYCIWNTFGPIASSAKKTFNWSNGDIATLTNWDTILFIFLSIQVAWLIQKQGLKISFLCSLFLVATGSVIKCMTGGTTTAIWFMNAGQIFNALGGMVAQAAGPFISNTWFPPNERTTATAIASLSSPLGVAISYIIGPLIVPDLADVPTNDTLVNNRTHMRDKIEDLMYVQCIVACVLFMVSLFYFPNKPYLPPSMSAAMPKFNFFNGMKKLMHKKDFWLILIVAASITGVYSGWSAILVLNFQDHLLEVTQIDCGWIGFSSTMVSVMAGVLVGYIADRFPRNIKNLLIGLYTVATLAFLWVTLICNKFIPYNNAMIYAACIIGGFAVNGSIPLLFEITIESTYPIPEVVSIACLSLMNNIFTFLFLLLLNIPGIGVAWMNWLMLSVCMFCTVLLCLFKEDYKRSDIDSHTTSDKTVVGITHAIDTYI